MREPLPVIGRIALSALNKLPVVERLPRINAG